MPATRVSERGKMQSETLNMTRILETDEQGTLTIPADILGHPAAHQRFVVEGEGDDIRIERQKTAATTSHYERMCRWSELASRISAVWPEGISAVDAVAEQRR